MSNKYSKKDGTVIEEIKIDAIRAVVKVMKSLDKNWAKNLAESMHKEDSSITETRVYDIHNSRLRHQQYRMLFIQHAKGIIDNAKGKLSEANSTLQEILANK